MASVWRFMLGTCVPNFVPLLSLVLGSPTLPPFGLATLVLPLFSLLRLLIGVDRFVSPFFLPFIFFDWLRLFTDERTRCSKCQMFHSTRECPPPCTSGVECYFLPGGPDIAHIPQCEACSILHSCLFGLCDDELRPCSFRTLSGGNICFNCIPRLKHVWGKFVEGSYHGSDHF